MFQQIFARSVSVFFITICGLIIYPPDGETWAERYQRVAETYLLPGATAKLKNITPDECLNITYDLLALGDFVQEQIVRFSVTAAMQDVAVRR